MEEMKNSAAHTHSDWENIVHKFGFNARLICLFVSHTIAIRVGFSFGVHFSS